MLGLILLLAKIFIDESHMGLFYIYLSKTPYYSLLITYLIVVNQKQNSNHKTDTLNSVNFMIPLCRDT